MGKAVSKPIQVALDCFLWRNIDVTNFDQVYRKLLWSNNRCKKLNKFIKTCKKTAFVNTGCKILQTTGQLINITHNYYNIMYAIFVIENKNFLTSLNSLLFN